MGEKEYHFVDFRKLLINTIGDAIEAREARMRMADVIDEFRSSIYDVVWSDMPVSEKANDIQGLADQLKEEIVNLGEAMSRSIVVATKSLSLMQ